MVKDNQIEREDSMRRIQAAALERPWHDWRDFRRLV
jgi:hypothetical protein